MNPRTSVATAIAFALCVTSVALAQEQLQFEELPNMSQVNSNLFRGGQPKEGGIARLKQLGIKTIINLRDNDDRSKSEEAEVMAMGLKYFNIPLPHFERPEDKTISEILSLITSSENQPIFVHCKRGSDRTGTIVAVYRIAFDGWTSEKAKAEAKQHGMGFWQYRMKDYIRDYYSRRSRQSKTGERRPTQFTQTRPHFKY